MTVVGAFAASCGDAPARDDPASPPGAPHAATPQAHPADDATTAPGDAARSSTPVPSAPVPSRAWLDPGGTSIVGFGILRVVPEPGKVAALHLRYRETPDGYSTKGNLQLFVLPGDAFAVRDRAYADRFLGFTRTADTADVGDDGTLRLELRNLRFDRETTVLVGYGPWTAPDAGRPAGDDPVFRLDATADDGDAVWIESEAGELITTNWTGRPQVERGGPFPDPVAGSDVWLEIRPMILYDARFARTAGDGPAVPLTGPSPADLRAEALSLERAGRHAAAADRRERADDIEAEAARADRRIVLTPALAEKFRRVPIRWR